MSRNRTKGITFLVWFVCITTTLELINNSSNLLTNLGAYNLIQSGFYVATIAIKVFVIYASSKVFLLREMGRKFLIMSMSLVVVLRFPASIIFSEYQQPNLVATILPGVIYVGIIAFYLTRPNIKELFK